MLNVVLLLMSMLSTFSGGPNLEPAIDAGIKSPVVHAALTFEPAKATYSPAEEVVTLNEIALTDRIEDVIRKKGEPLEITVEPLLETTDYHYEDMTIGFSNGLTEFVHVTPAANFIEVNGLSVPMIPGEIVAAFGEPYYEGEDGIVYVWNHQAIKVYLDQQSGEISGVDLFVDYSQ
ncbi:hypothetical protein [Paenibacillus lemnae]|uniref:Uncharacterized protein n=1 Tax=Paenibacillus lemnae TaxID=1330551 RepID=A0A848M7V1_PAELE|nr:hypothetical protein [Paenibacillus lemnae]NMO97278.1 hypothetical protein [Paenibacillus lemnae]